MLQEHVRADLHQELAFQDQGRTYKTSLCSCVRCTSPTTVKCSYTVTIHRPKHGWLLLSLTTLTCSSCSRIHYGTFIKKLPRRSTVSRLRTLRRNSDIQPSEFVMLSTTVWTPSDLFRWSTQMLRRLASELTSQQLEEL